MVFPIVYDQADTSTKLQQIADVFCELYGFWTYLDRVARPQVILCLLSEKFIRLKLGLSVFSGPITYGELELSSLLVNNDNFFTPLSSLIVVELVDGQRIKEFVSNYKAWISHQVLRLLLHIWVHLLFFTLVGQHLHEV
jgi:hypothetical protein